MAAAEHADAVGGTAAKKPPKLKLIGNKLKNISAAQIDLDFIHPTELARQMSLIDFKLYQAIQVSECLHQNWTRAATKNERAPNLLAMIKQFNDVGLWVISQIVSVESLEKRFVEQAAAANLNHFLSLTHSLSHITELLNSPR